MVHTHSVVNLINKIPRRQAKKRASLDILNDLPEKRKRMSQGLKRKKEDDDRDLRKRARFPDWI